MKTSSTSKHCRLEGSHLRSRHHGFLRMQDEGGSPAAILQKLDELCEASRRAP